jgi:hypothetical protein
VRDAGTIQQRFDAGMGLHLLFGIRNVAGKRRWPSLGGVASRNPHCTRKAVGAGQAGYRYSRSDNFLTALAISGSRA